MFPGKAHSKHDHDEFTPLTFTHSQGGGTCDQPRIAGYYNDGEVTICQFNPDRFIFTLIHEVAHHLDRQLLTDKDRHQLLADWGLEHWSGSDVSWGDRGEEIFADSIAHLLWGRLSGQVVKRGTRSDEEMMPAAVTLSRRLYGESGVRVLPDTSESSSGGASVAWLRTGRDGPDQRARRVPDTRDTQPTSGRKVAGRSTRVAAGRSKRAGASKRSNRAL